MKRLIRSLVAPFVSGGLIVLGMALARPNWLPTWARLDPDRLPAWVHLGGLQRALADEDDQDRRVEVIPTTKVGARAESWPVVRLASGEWARRIGLETAPVIKERHSHRLTCNAETTYDARRSAEVLPRVAGVLRAVRVDLGQVVRKGAVLAVVDSAQVGAAKAQYLMARSAVDLAQVTYDRTVKLTQARAAPGKNELEALTALNQAQATRLDAEQKLRNLGFTDADLRRIAQERDSQNLLEIVAPIDGTIIAWDATIGEAVEPTTQLFGMADITRMWLWIDVYEHDIASVASGQPITFTIAGIKSPTYAGQVTWVGTEVHATTRTARVRAELANPGGRLRANQFGQARVQVEPAHEALVVPRAAVQNDGDVNMVFLPLSDSAYRPQRVEILPTDRDDVVEVVRGLEPGQRVVTTRAYMLKSELFKDRLGAADND
jgi:cobalt-zinc-cadmium efflux system membrane fusion protein